jgi:hypothetical protein
VPPYWAFRTRSMSGGQNGLTLALPAKTAAPIVASSASSRLARWITGLETLDAAVRCHDFAPQLLGPKTCARSTSTSMLPIGPGAEETLGAVRLGPQ